MEKMGYAAPEKEIEPEPEPEISGKEDKSKNLSPRVKENRQEHESMKRGDSDKTDSRINEKPSVKKKIEGIKTQMAKKDEKKPEKTRSGENPVQRKKKKKIKKKYKDR